MKKLSKTDAAEKLLRKYNRPMTYREIIQLSIKEGLIETKGKTPEQTLRVDVKKEIDRRKIANKKQRFDNSIYGIISLVKE